MTQTTILTVEDDPLQLDLLETLLFRQGYAVLRAKTGEEALDQLVRHPEIDLMLLDVMLPGQLDGYAVCRRVRADLKQPYVPVLMVTALGKTEQIARGLESGADDYITKPYDTRELLTRIRAALRVRNMQRDLIETQNRYRVLVETSHDLIFALDRHGQLTYISPASETLTGYSADALLADQSAFARVIHPEDTQRFTDWQANLSITPDGSDLEFRIVRADGQVRWCALAWSMIVDRDGRLSGVQGTLRDITQRREMEAASWRRSQELAALNLIAAHLNQSLELTNTLTEALNALLEVVAADYGAIHVMQDDQLGLQAAYGWSENEANLALYSQSDRDLRQLRDLFIAREELGETRGAISLPLKALAIQCLLHIPLLERGALTGVLTLAARHIEKFDATEITLISTVAEQINAAIINARLYEEARHRAGELGVLYEIGRMLNSTLDLDKVLRVIMEAAVNVLQAEAGSILLLDEQTQELVFVASVGAGSDVLLGVRLPAGAGIAGQAWREGRTFVVEEPATSPAFYQGVDRLTGIQTQGLIAVPLRAKDTTIGVMEVVNKRHGRFTAADVRRIDLLAPTAAAAIDNARLYTRERQLTAEVRRHNRELSALHAISAALSQLLEIQEVMDTALVVLQPQIEYDDGRIQVAGHSQVYRSAHQVSAAIKPPDRVAVVQRFTRQAVESGMVKLLPDTRQLGRRTAAIWRSAGIGAFAVIPLWSHDQVQGALTLAWQQPRQFERDAAQLFAAIGQQIGVALERATLYEVAQRRADEIERSYAQLVQAEKLAATGRLAMSLAHEINNPLQAIQNCLHLVLEFPLDAERQTTYLNLAREEVERLSILAQSMLDFYRPSRTGQAAANVQIVTERVLALADQKLRQNQVEAVLSFPAQPVLARIAPDQLGQVCLNLIMNAAEAMEHGGRLTITASAADNDLELRFADTGPGISPEVMAHIFEPFYSTKEEGTGLGLAISYTILERQGGSLEVVSTHGQGTTFIVHLPRAAQEADLAPAEQLTN